ncbi:PAS domain-containing protein [Streptomyces sp. NPDC001852]|uniref:PAS domain-containing protein n=1 Tax=Streptomyces sp. NPDC001852 TaxID=3364619 RepID=UPI003698C692
MDTPSALLTLDGVIRSLNAAIATQLGRPWAQCVGHGFVDLLPEDQRMSAEGLLTHGATTKRLRCVCGSFRARAPHVWSASSRRER